MRKPLQWEWNDGGRQTAGFAPNAPGDCTCRAIAIVTEQPYLTVYGDLNQLAHRIERRGRRGGLSSSRTGVHKSTIRRYMAALGWTWISTMGIGTGCRFHLAEDELPMKGRLLVQVSKHLTAVVEGVIHDLYDPTREGTRCVYGYWRGSE